MSPSSAFTICLSFAPAETPAGTLSLKEKNGHLRYIYIYILVASSDGKVTLVIRGLAITDGFGLTAAVSIIAI